MPSIYYSFVVAASLFSAAGGVTADRLTAPDCGEQASVYRGQNERQAWLTRFGLIERQHKRMPYFVAEVMFDDGTRALLHGTDALRWRIAEEVIHLSGQAGQVLWQSWERLPSAFGVVGEDGSAGPLFEFSRCEQGAPPAVRLARKEFWD